MSLNGMEKRYNPDIHHRRSVRLRDYDYAQEGLYFVTVCVQNRECLFGKITDSKMILNEMGEIASNEWLKTAELRKNVQLHNFVVMPNHFHAIVEIVGVPCVQLPLRPYARLSDEQKNEYMSGISPKSGALGIIVKAFKSAVTKNIHEMGLYFAWQRGFHDHIIRDRNDHTRIANYIDNNPARWDIDCFNQPR
jgi:REP element-mobilizing transposase RayT